LGRGYNTSVAVLEFQQITKEYRTGLARRRVCALDDFSLSVGEGVYPTPVFENKRVAGGVRWI